MFKICEVALDHCDGGADQRQDHTPPHESDAATLAAAFSELAAAIRVLAASGRAAADDDAEFFGPEDEARLRAWVNRRRRDAPRA